MTALPPGLYVRFDGPPDHDAPRFIEVEDEHGVGVRIEWRQDGNDWLLGPFQGTQS